MKISVLAVMPDPDNPRADLGDLRELVEDIRANGIIQPIVVRPGSKDHAKGTCSACGQEVDRLTSGMLQEHDLCPGGSSLARDEWIILAGHRRYAAARQAGLREVPVVVDTSTRSRADRLAFMLRENGHRRDLTVFEESHAYEQLTLEGLTVARIATITRRSKDRIRRHLEVAKLPEESRAKIGEITLEDAEALLGLSGAAHERALEAIGKPEFRQTVIEERLSGDVQEEDVARELRAEFLRPILAGSVIVKDYPAGQVMASLQGSLPAKVVRAWLEAVGRPDGDFEGVSVRRAMLALAVVAARDLPSEYRLLQALGYEVSPVEERFMEAS